MKILYTLTFLKYFLQKSIIYGLLVDNKSDLNNENSSKGVFNRIIY